MFIVSIDSPNLDKLYGKFPMFEVGPFGFQIMEAEEYANFPDYSLYGVKNEGVTVPYDITVVDVAVRCGSRSSINLADFL